MVDTAYRCLREWSKAAHAELVVGGDVMKCSVSCRAVAEDGTGA